MQRKLSLVWVRRYDEFVSEWSFCADAIQSDSVRFVPIHSDSLRFVPIRSDSLRFVPIHSDSFRFIPTYSVQSDSFPSHFWVSKWLILSLQMTHFWVSEWLILGTLEMTQNDSVMQLSQSIAIRRKRLDQSGSCGQSIPCPYSLTNPYLIPYGMASQQLQLAAQAPYASCRT